MKIEYMVEEKSALVKNCWISLNKGRFFKTKKDAQKYISQYKKKHPKSTLRISQYDWVNENIVNVN